MRHTPSCYEPDDRREHDRHDHRQKGHDYADHKHDGFLDYIDNFLYGNSHLTNHRSSPAYNNHHATQDAPHDLTTAIGGEAVAVGQDTFAGGVITNTLEKTPTYSIATGEATFQASAISEGGGKPVAAADTFLDVSGADFLFAVKVNQTGHSGDAAWATSDLQYVAIDFANWSPPCGRTITQTITLNISNGSCAPQTGQVHFASGNVADVLALADSQGPNTLAATLTQALTVENHFSSVSGFSLVA